MKSEIELVLARRIVELEGELAWKDALLKERTQALYDMIQSGQKAINKLPAELLISS